VKATVNLSTVPVAALRAEVERRERLSRTRTRRATGEACRIITFGLGRKAPRPLPKSVTMGALSLASGFTRTELTVQAIAQDWPTRLNSKNYPGPRQFIVDALPLDLKIALERHFKKQELAHLGFRIERHHK
jgi:hypothetical protein